MKLADLNKFQSISTDTRTLQPGDVFVALIGDNFDGHDYIKEAEQKGAIALVVDREVESNIPIIKTGCALPNGLLFISGSNVIFYHLTHFRYCCRTIFK